jgi:dihydrofolate synthase/folylpolyglutamate synthase
MNYKDTLEWMFSRLPMYQRQGKTAFKKDLTNTLALAEHLNNPHKHFKSVHVAGTNGKGSTSHMIASVLQEAGYKVGLYTSPHLKDFRERIKINGKLISESEVIKFINSNKTFLEQQKLSFFEMTVGLAFDYFAKQEVDIAIIEVGLGGRLDSTNIITPLVSVITNIGYDHTQFLGETLAEIASEKGGIIKKGVPVIIGEQQAEIEHVFFDIALTKDTTIAFAEEDVVNYKMDVLGSYQQKNLTTAIRTITELQKANFLIKEDHIIQGLQNVVKNTGLLGRWQILNKKPLTICDTAHNKEGLIYVLKQLLNEQFDQLHIVMGVVNDKNLGSILELFPKNATYYFCKPNIPRGLDAKLLKEQAKRFDLNGKEYKTVMDGLYDAQKAANKEDLIFIGGSTFVVAEVV